MTIAMLGYLISISLDFYDYIFPFSYFFLFSLIEHSCKTLFDHISKHLEIHQKTPLRVVFSALLSVFGNVVKHNLSCWICYFNFSLPRDGDQSQKKLLS